VLCLRVVNVRVFLMRSGHGSWVGWKCFSKRVVWR
jgi:hypothetical protein